MHYFLNVWDQKCQYRTMKRRILQKIYISNNKWFLKETVSHDPEDWSNDADK